jgi:hypothetical protein
MGFWSLSNIEASQNYTGHGDYGFDTVGIELPESGGLMLKN